MSVWLPVRSSKRRQSIAKSSGGWRRRSGKRRSIRSAFDCRYEFVTVCHLGGWYSRSRRQKIVFITECPFWTTLHNPQELRVERLRGLQLQKQQQRVEQEQEREDARRKWEAELHFKNAERVRRRTEEIRCEKMSIRILGLEHGRGDECKSNHGRFCPDPSPFLMPGLSTANEQRCKLLDGVNVRHTTHSGRRRCAPYVVFTIDKCDSVCKLPRSGVRALRSPPLTRFPASIIRRNDAMERGGEQGPA